MAVSADSAIPAGDSARSALVARLLGTTRESAERAGLRCPAVRVADGAVEIVLEGSGGLALTVRVGPRDDARPAYVRTRLLDLSYATRGAPVEGAIIPRLFARMARALADVGMDALLAGLGEGPVADVRVRVPVPAPASVPRETIDDLSGDLACGMMGAVAVLQEIPSKIAVLITGDRGCVPPSDGPWLRVFTADLRDIDVIRGAEARIREAAAWVVERMGEGPPLPVSRTLPRAPGVEAGSGRGLALVMISTCLSEMIGEDLAQAAAAVEAAHGIPVVAIRAHGLEPLRPAAVAARVHKALAARFVGTPGAAPAGIARVGYPDPGGELGREVRGIAAAAGIVLGPCWPDDGLDGLARLGDAAVVLAPDRGPCGPMLARVESLGACRVVIHPAPYGLTLARSFFRELGERAGRAAQVAAATADRVEAATARVAAFRARHEGRRVAVCFGANRKGTSFASTVHLGIGYVPLLLDVGLVPVLVCLPGGSGVERSEVERLAARLGAAPDVFVHCTPEALPGILREARVDLAVNEDCQKHHVDAAGVPYAWYREFRTGFDGFHRTLDLLEVLLT